MKFEQVMAKNVEIAIGIQKEIFPLESGAEDIKEASHGICPKHQFLQKYWLAKDNDEYIGIVGLYAYKDYPKDAWLGWFGVLKQYRNKGFAKEIINFAMNKALEMGFNNLRLYTDEEENLIATKLYEKLGMIKEEYINEDDIHFQISKTLIYSISLTDKQVELWNNKNLFLNSHDEKNL